MGRQHKVGNGRSLREIHGTGAAASALPAEEGDRRRRGSSRSRGVAPPCSDSGRGLTSFGNIVSSPPELAVQHLSRGRGKEGATPVKTEQDKSVQKTHALETGARAACYSVAPPIRFLSSDSSVCSNGDGYGVPRAHMGDTIVGVSNGGAYTIGPVYGSRSQYGQAATRVPRRVRRKLAVVIPLFMLANLVYFMVTMYSNNCPAHHGHNNCTCRFLRAFSFQPLKENPLLGPTASTLLHMGAVDSVVTPAREGGWRLLSCLWLHTGLLHLLTTMFGLGTVGVRFEQDFGWQIAGLAYLISGVGGSLLTALLYKGKAASGASGALLGLVGATMAEISCNGTNYRHKCRMLLCVAAVVALCAFLGLMPNVGNFSHIGGAISGFLLAFVFLVHPQLWSRPANSGYDPDDSIAKPRSLWYILVRGLALVLILALYVVVTVTLFTKAEFRTHCSICRHLSCIPTRLWRCSFSQ